MNDRYEAFCMASPLFYDALHSEQTAGASFRTAQRPLPAGWRREAQDDWLVFVPPDLELSPQGWKIHVSACLDNADQILDAVWDYCLPRGIEFKFLRSEAVLWLRSSKYAPRAYSGKLVTIYPPDESAFERTLRELGTILDGQPGPYILSDLRWGAGPLHVRYGGFAARYCVSDDGQVVLAIADDTGKLVPDRRDPVFYLPPWVPLPDFLAPHLAARNAVTVADLPYTIESAMHFSNGGGLYRGRDTRTDEEIVLKEGRPHAGLDGSGADAVSRVRREYEMLQRLAGIPGVPRGHELFAIGEHQFMAMEYIDGIPLHKVLVRRYPMIDISAGPAEFASYTDWALEVYRQVESTIDAMHRRGVVYGDLHLFNILIRPDESVCLLDFEVASLVSEQLRPALGNQGFAAPKTTTGVDVDRWALACLRLALFLPITPVLWLSRAKVTHLAEVIAEYFPVPPEFLAAAVEVIAPPADAAVPRQRLALDRLNLDRPNLDRLALDRPDADQLNPDELNPDRLNLDRPMPDRPAPDHPGPGRPPLDWPPLDRPIPDPSELGRPAPDHPVLEQAHLDQPRLDRLDPQLLDLTGEGWPAVRGQLANAILATATPQREDRLFPGDIEQFRLGALGLAYGAAGVLHALSVTGAGRHPELEEWLVRQVKNPPHGTLLGLYDGLHGAAFALEHLGYRQEALDALAMCLAEDWQTLGLDLIGGIAGIGLNLAHFADRTGEPALRQAAQRAAEVVIERLGDEDSVAETSSLEHPYAGLFRGSAGPALLLLRMYDDTGEQAYLDHAAVALRQDLRRCVLRDNGVMEVNEGWRTMPYLAVGSVGVGLALDEYLTYRHDERFAEANKAIRRAAQSRLYVQPGLFSGRAGILLYLAGRSAAPRTDADVLLQLRALSWHALPFADGIAFPGDQLLRLSMDVATGTAGVLLALGAVLHDEPVSLPLLTPRRVVSPHSPARNSRGLVSHTL